MKERPDRDPDTGRRRFTGNKGDACKHCRLSERSHIEPRKLCPEWALRASDGDR